MSLTHFSSLTKDTEHVNLDAQLTLCHWAQIDDETAADMAKAAQQDSDQLRAIRELDNLSASDIPLLPMS